MEEKEDNGRISKDNTDNSDTLPVSRPTSKSTGNDDKKDRTTSKDIRDDKSTVDRTADKAREYRQFLKDKLKRSREGNGRSSSDSVSEPESSNRDGRSSRGIAVERLDEIPVRFFDIEEEKAENPKKSKITKEQIQDTAIKVKKTFFKPGTVLSDQEAKEYTEILPDALIDYGEYADKLIRWRTQQAEVDMLPIWGDLSDEEAQTLTRVLIRRGKKSGVAAELVRELAEGYDYIATAVIVVPRTMKTTFELKRAPRGIK